MRINVVLVRTENSNNIGAAARALANMGGDRLILVDPRCEINVQTRQMAAGAQTQLEKTTLYPDWSSFYATEGEGLRIALTRRTGQHRKVDPLQDKIAEAAAAKSTLSSIQDVYLVFGPEADGLANEDLAYINWVCNLPVYGEFGSLNLAQAVLLALYILRSHWPAEEPRRSQLKGPKPDPIAPLYFPDKLIKEWLTAMGFDVQARRSSAYLTLRRLFAMHSPTQHEWQVLEAVLWQNIRKLRKVREECGEPSLGLAAEELADDFTDISGQ